MMSTSNLWSATSRYIHPISPHEGGAISPGESHLRASNKISKCTKLILYKYIQSTECEMSLTVENRWKQARRAGTRFLPWSLPASSSTKTFLTQTGNDVPLGRDAHIVFRFVWNVEPQRKSQPHNPELLVPHVWLICRWLVDVDLISLWLVSAILGKSGILRVWLQPPCPAGCSTCDTVTVYTPDKKSAVDLFPFVALEDPRLIAQIHNAGDIVNSWVVWSCAHLVKDILKQFLPQIGTEWRILAGWDLSRAPFWTN